MDDTDKKGFKRYIIVLFFGSIFSILGIGAVIPFINVLIQPEKITTFWLFQNWEYDYIVLFFTILLIIAFALKNLIALFLLIYQSKFLFGLMAKIQKKLFTGYMAQPYEYHLNRSTPDLIKNINNETTILSNYIIAPLGNFLTEFISSCFVLIVLIMVSPVFTILVAVFLFLGVIYFMQALKRKIEYYSNIRTQAWSSMTKHVLSGLSGIKEAKLYHCEDIFLNTFIQDANQLKSSSAFQYTFQQAPRMLIEFIGLTVVMSVLCGYIFFGQSPKSMFVLLGVFGVAAAQLLPSLNRLTQALAQIKYGMPALKTIYAELYQNTKEQLNTLHSKKMVKRLAFNQVIDLSNLSYTYRDGTVALCNVNVKIQKNKKIAFVGKTGAGKTTLVDLLMGMYVPNSGDILIDGNKLNLSSDIFSFQKLFAYIPQTIVLYDRSIKENIAFGVEENNIDTEHVWRCLKLAQLDKFVEELDEGENTFIGEEGIRLSGGQRQRVGIARALYQNPEILVMDEATSALDNQTEKEVTSVLSELKDLTIITIAHRLTTIKDYDIIYVLDKGCILASGKYDELLEKCDIFQRIVKATDKI